MTTKSRWHLTSEEKGKIRRLSLAGMRSTHIALRLGINRNSVIKWRKAMGLSTKPILPEKRILALLKRRMEQRRIARTLKIPYRQVQAFARRAGFARPYRPLSQEKLLAILSDILHRTASAAAISKKHGAPYKTVLSLAHVWLQCEKFLPTWKRPLESYFPSRPPLPMKEQEQTTQPDHYVELVQGVLEKSFDGKFPFAREHDAHFIAAILACFQRFVPDFEGQSPQVVDRFAQGLVMATDLLRRQQAARWQN